MLVETLNRFARLASSRSEVVGAALILLMVMMMVIPLSPTALDVLLAINFAISILLVISAFLVESPLAFSTFPAMLLMTTLFRLSLTISTTRQILLEADAGHIVQTFGEFVVGGNFAVGLVIFLIISVVNFLVITKGSERIAEVAARFSLDGMPGKQMSIDSDLRAGLITQAIAKKRRSDLEKESQLFGAMDGAIKFVKNDAIASLVITVVNLLGGLAVGMLQKDMSFGDAGRLYVILSVGDGLVAIIPSLLISIAAGLVITRVTKGEMDGGNAAQDIIRELGANSKALQISGITCFLVAFVPGMPSFVFMLIGSGFIYAWYKCTSDQSGKSGKPIKQTPQQSLDELRKDQKLDDVTSTSVFCPVEVRIPADTDPSTWNTIENVMRAARNQLVDELGVLIPIFEFSPHKESDLIIYVYGVPSLRIDLSETRVAIRSSEAAVMAMKNELNYSIEKDSVTGSYHLLVDQDKKGILLDAGIPVISFEQRLADKMKALLVKKIDQLFTLNEAQRHMAKLGELFSEQIKEIERVLPATKIVEVLQRLLREWVSIKHMRSILNSLIEWGQRERDPLIITEQVRRGLYEQICYQHTFDQKLWAFVLSVELEQLIRESARSDGSSSFIDMDASSMNEIAEMIERQISSHLPAPFKPILICSVDCRAYVRQIIEDTLFSVPVLSHQEISSQFEIKLLGTVALEERTQLAEE